MRSYNQNINLLQIRHIRFVYSRIDQSINEHKTYFEIMHIDGGPSATHNVYTYRFKARTGPFIKVSIMTGDMAGDGKYL